MALFRSPFDLNYCLEKFPDEWQRYLTTAACWRRGTASLVLEVDEDPAEVLIVFLQTMVRDLICGWFRKRRTRFLSWPLPLPGMISTSAIFLRMASSMMR